MTILSVSDSWAHKTQDKDNTRDTDSIVLCTRPIQIISEIDTGQQDTQSRAQYWTVSPEELTWTYKTQDKDNPETLTVLGIQDTGQRQSRETVTVFIL